MRSRHRTRSPNVRRREEAEGGDEARAAEADGGTKGGTEGGEGAACEGTTGKKNKKDKRKEKKKDKKKAQASAHTTPLRAVCAIAAFGMRRGPLRGCGGRGAAVAAARTPRLLSKSCGGVCGNAHRLSRACVQLYRRPRTAYNCTDARGPMRVATSVRTCARPGARAALPAYVRARVDAACARAAACGRLNVCTCARVCAGGGRGGRGGGAAQRCHGGGCGAARRRRRRRAGGVASFGRRGKGVSEGKG
eukprot:6198924-Pleurochrysis_carterae.AAC.2